tara:strand:- start:1168 stop:1656 length:489 start_codon:yes stop_codon:yes gene_type:complete
MNKIFLIFASFLSFSCSDLEFVYKDNKNLINPIYEKVEVKTSGAGLIFVNSYIPVLFGENETNELDLLINVEEKKIKRSVETNQATSNLSYELRFYYTLISNKKNCSLYEKEILSSFTIIPKSAGYNYGTDASLEKKYKLAISDNLNQFLTLISSADINSCK